MPKPSGRVDQNEREIAKRVRMVRFHSQLSKPAFAKALGVSLDRIASVEYGRTPLVVSVADKISATFDINLIWLAHGKGRMKPCAGLISTLSPEINDSELLSKAVTPEFEARARGREDFYFFALSAIMAGEATAKDEASVARIAEGLRSHFDELFSELPQPGKLKLLAVLVRTLAKFERDWELGNHRNPGENIVRQPKPPKKELTKVSESVNVAGVKPKLPSLLKRLETSTCQRGKKSELANFLGVSLVQVSQWLSGDREPGGETTLRLLQWVEQQERQH